MKSTVPNTRRNGQGATKIDRRKNPAKRAKPKHQLSRRIDELAAECGISRIDMAKRCEAIPVSFNRTLVEGHIAARHIPILAEMLGVSSHFLLTGSDDDRVEIITRQLVAAAEELDNAQMILRTFGG